MDIKKQRCRCNWQPPPRYYAMTETCNTKRRNTKIEGRQVVFFIWLADERLDGEGVANLMTQMIIFVFGVHRLNMEADLQSLFGLHTT